MAKLLTVFLISIFASPVLADPNFGAKIAETEGLTLEQALQKFKEGQGSDLVIEAKVETVCEKKGCWMTLTDKPKDLRVTFKDYGFFVPISLVGKKVRLAGSIEEKKMTLKETKHFVEDAGGDPAKVTSPRSEYRFIASGVQVIQ